MKHVSTQSVWQQDWLEVVYQHGCASVGTPLKQHEASILAGLRNQLVEDLRDLGSTGGRC